MAEAHENLEHAEHAQHASHSNRKIALLISVLALFLAFSETLGKSAQTVGIELNIKASDTWNFFQAKTIRQTTLRTAAEAMVIEIAARPDDQYKKAMTDQVERWKATVARYESDPKEQDGRRELMALAKKYEAERDLALAKYHNFEFGSAAYQIGIVLASAAVITGIVALAYAAAGVGLIGLMFTGLGLFGPNVMHDVQHWLESLLQGSGHH
jgi:hypothetical protein